MNEADYQLSKSIPDMARGFVIQTNYGEIRVNADDPECQKIIAQVKKLLERRQKSGG